MIYTSQFDYEVISPDRWTGAKNAKLLVVLHGRGDSLRPFRRFNEELPLEGFTYLLLNAPRKYDGGYTWYAFPPKQGPEIVKNREKLILLLGELVAQGWDLKNIFFLGFSQGSLMSIDLALHFTEAFGGVIGISGYIYFFDKWKKDLDRSAYETPILVTHGIRDIDLPIEDTRKDVWKLVYEAAIPIEWREFDKEHEICVNEETPYIQSWIYNKLAEHNNQFDRLAIAAPHDLSL